MENKDLGEVSVFDAGAQDPSAPSVVRFTPGPWRMKMNGNIGNAIEGCAGRKSFEGDDGYRTLATYQDACDSGLYDEQEANRIANGRLIAAAPTMYAALVHAEAVLSIVMPRSHMKEYLETLDEVRAALAKASSPIVG